MNERKRKIGFVAIARANDATSAIIVERKKKKIKSSAGNLSCCAALIDLFHLYNDMASFRFMLYKMIVSGRELSRPSRFPFFGSPFLNAADLEFIHSLFIMTAQLR